MKIKLLLIMALLLAPILSFAKSLTSQRENFVEAYDILHKGGLYTGSHLQDYSLHSYLDYERIKQHLKITRDQALINFINANPKSLLANNLRTELLVRLAKQRRWTTLLKFHINEQGGNKARCASLEAKFYTSTGKQRQSTLQAAKSLWLSGNPRPNSCSALFDLLKKHKLIDSDAIWQRISLAMNKGKTRLASGLAKGTKHHKLTSLWIRLRKKPSQNLSNKLLKKNNAKTRQLLTYAIKRIARKDTDKAQSKWEKLQKSRDFSREEKADVNSYIAIRDALDHKPNALKQFMAIPNKLRSSDANIWMARIAIRKGRWQEALNAINSMSDDDKKQDVWVYWRTYSNHRLGKKSTPENYYELSKSASFYGFLAADQLERPYERLEKDEPDWGQFIPDIKKIKGIQRATELYQIGYPRLARKEWMWELKRLSHHDKLVAAAYALEINQPFLAIITVSQTKDWNQVGLRFPMKYQTLVEKSAKQQNIEPAWVYGIMRRESAFDAKISSSANAKGLMQVLPRTAKEVARKLGIKNHRTSDLLIPEKNVRLGSAYLSQMLNKFKGNYAKATASYNAGPHRVPKWVPEYPIVAPRWIESIPFNETRNYVRAVMSYTTIYDYKLNQASNNKTGKTMGKVAGKLANKITKKQASKNLRLSQRLHPIGGNQ